ncbi:hypothetical protein Aduo_013419 [Ancylostoma duodenale]
MVSSLASIICLAILENCKFFPPNGECYPRCMCKKGYYRSYTHGNSITGACVPAKVCEAEPCLDPNAVREPCGLAEMCKTTCTRGDKDNAEVCSSMECVLFACECKAGYILDDYHGKCLRLSECKRPNEEHVYCSEKCEPPCAESNVKRCKHQPACFPRCTCKEGYYRNSSGICTNDCMPEPCKDPNAIRKPCGKDTYCQPTCKYGNDTKFCEPHSENVGFECECKPGYILDDWNGKCIPIEDCKCVMVSIIESHHFVL